MAGEERLICASQACWIPARRCASTSVLRRARAGDRAAFRGKVYAYLNRCSHLPMELDWREGEVFDFEGRDLICSTHGATYAADSGKCLGGPCSGTPLVALQVEERDGKVFFKGIDDG